MDLEKIENRKKNFKSSGFRNSKILNFYHIVIPIFSKSFTGRVFNHPVDEEVFWKNGEAKDFDFRQKKSQTEKKRGSSRVESSGLQLGMIPYFFAPEKSYFMSAILGLCLFPVIKP